MLKCDVEYESVKFVIRMILVVFYNIVNGFVWMLYYNLV